MLRIARTKVVLKFNDFSRDFIDELTLRRSMSIYFGSVENHGLVKYEKGIVELVDVAEAVIILGVSVAALSAFISHFGYFSYEWFIYFLSSFSHTFLIDSIIQSGSKLDPF